MWRQVASKQTSGGGEMTAGLRHLYLLSVLEALTTYAVDGGQLHFSTLDDGGKLAITFTLEDGAAYQERVTSRFNERFEAHEAATLAAPDGLS
jgi:hypothetical protein